jgi:hypothetical protein
MRTRSPILTRIALATAIAAAVPALAQEPAPPGAAAKEGKPAAAAATTPANPARPMLLPEVKVEGLPLVEVLNFLRDVDPTFQVVLAGPGAQGGGPIIHELKLKNVSAEAVLKLLAQTYPQISIDTVAADDQGSPIWTVVVGAPKPAGEGDPLFGGAGPGFDPAMGMPADRSAEPVTIVRRLRESIDHLAAGDSEEARAKARSAVLSLIQATIETQGGGGKAPATIKLHEPTDTLVFKGTAAQAQFVDEALGTLLPSKENQQAALQKQAEHYAKQVGRLEARLAELERKLGENRDAAEPATPADDARDGKPKQ